MIYLEKGLKITSILLISCFFFIDFQLLAQEVKIVESPLLWNQEREELSIAYLRKRHGIIQNDATIVPKMVVVHWTANNSYAETMDIFRDAKLRGRPELVNAGPLNVSSQYIIDRDGTIFKLLPDTIFARHTIGLNYLAIGIENIGSDKSPLTKAQLKANVALIKHLKAKHNIEYVIGHYEYGVFRNTDLWKECDPNYFTHKIDPGEKFMKKLRRKLKKLDFKKLPN